MFESKTGVMALVNLLLDTTGRAMGESAVRSLAEAEALWTEGGAPMGDLAP